EYHSDSAARQTAADFRPDENHTMMYRASSPAPKEGRGFYRNPHHRIDPKVGEADLSETENVSFR
ncbi:MAG: hypothetical protein IKY96_04920, partial [Oscillospiraceae bacterium]|nr:hypothetical protein [Oscillospiraceae bacterium]